MLSVILFIPVLTAAVTDLRTRRIPNVLTLGALVLLLPIAAMEGSLVTALAGGGLAGGLALAFALSSRGNFGMGDVKLLAYAGATVGFARVDTLLLTTAFAGGLIALTCLLIYRKRTMTIPYGPAIACGCAAALFM